MLPLEGCCVYIDSCRSVPLFQNSQTCYVQVWAREWPKQVTYPYISCTPTPQKPGAAAAAAAAAGIPGATVPSAPSPVGEVGAAITADTSVTVCIAFVGLRSSSKLTIVFSKIKESVKIFLTAAQDQMF